MCGFNTTQYCFSRDRIYAIAKTLNNSKENRIKVDGFEFIQSTMYAEAPINLKLDFNFYLSCPSSIAFDITKIL